MAGTRALHGSRRRLRDVGGKPGASVRAVSTLSRSRTAGSDGYGAWHGVRESRRDAAWRRCACGKRARSGHGIHDHAARARRDECVNNSNAQGAHESVFDRSEKNVKKTLCCAAIVVAGVAGLAGCAGVTTDVQVSGTPVVLQGERTYAIVQTPSQETGAAREQYEALIHSELGNYGLVDRSAERASYMLSLAYDTRPAAVGVIQGDCADSACNGVAKPGFPFFGREYQHSMTLRLFDA